MEGAIANLPASIKTAQLFRIDDNTTNPYPTRTQWDADAKAAGNCNSRCASDTADVVTDFDCPCLSYLTPVQIEQLNAASAMGQEEIGILPGGKISFELAPHASVNIRFPEC